MLVSDSTAERMNAKASSEARHQLRRDDVRGDRLLRLRHPRREVQDEVALPHPVGYVDDLADELLDRHQAPPFFALRRRRFLAVSGGRQVRTSSSVRPSSRMSAVSTASNDCPAVSPNSGSTSGVPLVDPGQQLVQPRQQRG